MVVAILAIAGAALGGLWAWSYRWLSEGRAYVEQGVGTHAQEVLARFLRLHPQHTEAQYLMGLAQGNASNWEAAVDWLRRVPDDSPEGANARCREADALLQLNRAVDAQRALLRALELDPRSLEARRGLIHLYRWQDRVVEARQLLWEAYELTPPHERAALLAEWFRIKFGQYPSAVAHQRLRDLMLAQPDDVDTAIALGRWSLKERQLGWAHTVLQQVVRQRPEKIEARAGLVECLIELGHAEEVERLLKDWPADQRDARFWRLEAMWQQEYAGDYAAAATNYRRLLEAEPDDWPARFRLATCLRRVDRADEAEREQREGERHRDLTSFERIREILNGTLAGLSRTENRYLMGEHYRALGCYREAAAWYETALQLDGGHEPSRIGLEQVRALELRRQGAAGTPGMQQVGV